MQHRRLMILFAIISVFAFGVILWYFLFSKPEIAPTLEGTANPLSLRDLPARFAFLFQDTPPETTTETEVLPPGSQPFLVVWDKPATGNVLVTKEVLREITATTTVGTSTTLVTRTVRATTTVLMFVDRITGYVYGHNIESGKTYQITNTTIPGIYDAYIWDNGTRILLRYLDADNKTIVSTLSNIPSVQEDGGAQPLLSTTFLPNNVTSVAVSPSFTSVSYVVPTSTGSSFYTITAKGSTKIADSPFGEWNLSYGGQQLYATPKASAYLEGSTYLLPSFSRILGDKTGLVSTGGDGGLTLNSMWTRSGLATFGTKEGVNTPLSVRTIASKCTAFGSPYFLCGVPKTIPVEEEGLPDDWYQGRASFDDTLVVVNAVTGESYTLYEIDEKYGKMDITHISTTSGRDIVSYIRKQDSSLFLLNTNLLSDGQ